MANPVDGEAPVGHLYFVSYAHAHGFGNATLGMKFPVRKYDDIVALKKVLDKANPGFDVCILNIVPLPCGTEKG